MSKPLLPPPPPPKEEPSSGFHLPGTNFTAPIRKHLEALEHPSHFSNRLEPNRGLTAAFLLGIPAGVINAAIWQFGAVPAVGFSFVPIVLSNFVGEAFKLFCVLAIALLLWGVVPNRRFGAALGAMVGLGFGLGGETLVIALNQFDAGHIFLSLVFITLMDVISASLIGIGIFVFVANKQRIQLANNFLGLPLFFYLLAGLSWAMWNALAFGAQSNYALSWLVDILITIPLFAFILRDFLGGHFNLTNFLKPLPERTLSPPPPLPPPPPPP